jgi:hypothetical protein
MVVILHKTLESNLPEASQNQPEGKGREKKETLFVSLLDSLMNHFLH